MAAMLIDSDSLDFVRELIVAGRYDPALAALDTLTARSPKSDKAQATPKQRWYLHTLTGPLPGWNTHWKACLLPLADAKRMIDELLSSGETTHGEATYKLNEKAAKKHSKRQPNDDIPW